jgi:pyruvate/2-oxoglutarate/acetoin dehydrogenase E1 component/TPP-dependent pyruvate/acetoin dehydrogenase alpha subunit
VTFSSTTASINTILSKSAFAALDAIDVARDLDGQVLRITRDGVSSAPIDRDRFSRTDLSKLYSYMALTRAVDREIVKLSRKGLAFGKHLMCTGNEACAVGAAYALRSDEWVSLAIRDLGVYVVRGVPLTSLLAQACGRTTGLTGGWDGSLHMGHRESHIAGLVSHLGTLVPIATGCAFAERYRNGDGAVLAFIGDGSTSTGDFHEAMNIASVLRLPLVVVVENNQWAFGTPNGLQYAVPTLAMRALAYGKSVEGYWVDGTDVVAVCDVVGTALARARQEGTISIVEAVSMRLEGHSLADPFKTYVPDQQLETWRRKDPIHTFRTRLLENGTFSSAEIDAFDTEVVEQVRAAAIEAEQAPAPSGERIAASVFAPSPEPAASERVPEQGRGTHIPYYKALHDALQEEMERDPSLFIIGEDVGISNGAFKITEGLSKRFDGVNWAEFWGTGKPFPQRRVIDAPISEAGFTGLALGAVLAGLRAIVEYQYADFASEAFKMIVNYTATQTVRGMGPVPIVFRLPSGWAPNTSLYHSVNPESWFASTPGLKIVAPITAYDAKGLLKAAVRDDNPVLFLEYKAFYRIAPNRLPAALNVPVPDDDYLIPLGRARILKGGRDLSVITYGSQVVRALEAIERVEKEDGVSIELIDLRTLVPWDAECVERSVRKTNRVLVTCEAPRTGSFGATLVADIAQRHFEHLDTPPMLVAAADTPVPFAPALEEAHLPTVGKLVLALRQLLAY